MSADTWICRQCGEEIDPQFEACWNCETPREEIDEQIDDQTETQQPPTAEPATPETMLAEILRNQQDQQETLRGVQFRVGCLYAFMIAIIIVILLQVLWGFSQVLKAPM